MGGNFSFYIIIIILVGIFFCLFVFVALPKLNRDKNRGKHQKGIHSGQISIFFDREGNVTIIPYIKELNGVGRAIAQPLFLKMPYKSEQLGKIARNGMALCKQATVGSDLELMTKLKAVGWKEFSEGKRNISIHYEAKYGIAFNTTRRLVDGAYQFNHFGFEKVLDPSVSDMMLGDTIVALLKRCR